LIAKENQFSAAKASRDYSDSIAGHLCVPALWGWTSMRKLTCFSTAAAVLITSVGLSATSAEARGRHGGWGHRHHDRIGTGDVIGGILILGTIAAIVGAASKSQDRSRRDRDYPDYRYDPPYRVDNRRDGQYQRPDTQAVPADYPGDDDVQSRANDACSWAVEGDLGDDARVDTITGTQRNGDGWYVTGTASRGDEAVRSFGCTYQQGRVVDVNYR
jgi:hypothetical protein